MLLLVGLAQVAYVLADCGRTPITPMISGYIVGGNEARAHSLPWTISMGMYYYGQDIGHFCGGSIVTDEFIVTAAHCLEYDYLKPYVTVGSHSLSQTDVYEERYEVAQVLVHPGYKRGDAMIHDIALLKLKTKITFTDGVQPVCLPEATQTWDEDVMFLVSGWGGLQEGKAGPDVLNQVMLPYYNHADCYVKLFGLIHEEVLCAGYEQGGKDSCQGDSGGPLVTLVDGQWTLGGVVSWGFGCARANAPGVYTDVAKYRAWIEHYTLGGKHP